MISCPEGLPTPRGHRLANTSFNRSGRLFRITVDFASKAAIATELPTVNRILGSVAIEPRR